MKRLRVLISSHEFSPIQGSECAMGWNLCVRMAKYHDVTVLCASGSQRNPNAYRQAVSQYFHEHGLISGLKVIFVDQPAFTLRCAGLNSKLFDMSDGAGFRPLYYMALDAWHRTALRAALNLGIKNFDVSHQLTPISFLRPGYLWTLELPFFWGPVGGMYKVPKSFSRSFGKRSFLFETFRSINIEWQVMTSRCFMGAVRKAALVFAITHDEQRVVRQFAGDRVVLMIDSAPPSLITGHIRQYDGRRPLRVCWSGLHNTRKALPLLLHAIARLPEPERIVLDILGEGPETLHWKKLARQLELLGITWYGMLPYQEAVKKMGQADVFVHTSIREAASHVVLEALGWGLPVFCHDACGMATAVDFTCGIKVPLENSEVSIHGFSEALKKILENPGLVESLSKGALHRASELSWDAKAKEIAESYNRFTAY